MAYKSRVPSGPRLYTKRYTAFRGVDFSSDPTQIDPSRSPYAPNLISDLGGYPEKRCGWSKLMQLGGRVNGLFCLEYDGVEYYFAHGGSRLYQLTMGSKSFTQLFSGLRDERSTSFCYDKRLWILTGGEYLVLSIVAGVVSVRRVEEIAYIPTLCISRAPDGKSSEPFEGRNLLQPTVRNSFVADGSSTKYLLTDVKLDAVPITVFVNGQAMPANGYTVDFTLGIVTFTTAPPAPTVLGQDNVVITYTKTIAGNQEKIKGCTIAARFGYGGDQRIFFSGNRAYKNYDWYSGFDDPSYIPEDHATPVGSDQSAVMGYLQVGKQQAVIKDDNGQESTIYLRSVAKNSEGETIFPLEAGISSAGAVSKQMILSLRDDPLFLTANGVFAIGSTAIAQERTIQGRSHRINPMLTTLGRMGEYVGCQWGNYLVMCNGIACYVADARSKTPRGESFEYEWYHWTGIPARVLLTVGELLYFGAEDGSVCCFKSDVAGNARYSDNGSPISCYWSTKVDDDGDFLMRKSLVKDGLGLLLKPGGGSVKLYVKKDDKPMEEVGSHTPLSTYSMIGPIYDKAPEMLCFTHRGESYRMLQILVKNEGINEGLGIYEIVKRYVVTATSP